MHDVGLFLLSQKLNELNARGSSIKVYPITDDTAISRSVW